DILQQICRTPITLSRGSTFLCARWMDLSDYLIAILRSPTWIVPISKFIDDHCAIFEDVEENKLEYTSVHNRFKELIDSLLAAHLCELQITEEQFAEFCHVGLTGD
ncbi:unnamed protein product, partial [Prorocentrum cordatum]